MKRKIMYAVVQHGTRLPEYNEMSGLALFKTKNDAGNCLAEMDNKIIKVYVTIERVKKNGINK